MGKDQKRRLEIWGIEPQTYPMLKDRYLNGLLGFGKVMNWPESTHTTKPYPQ